MDLPIIMRSFLSQYIPYLADVNANITLDEADLQNLDEVAHWALAFKGVGCEITNDAEVLVMLTNKIKNRFESLHILPDICTQIGNNPERMRQFDELLQHGIMSPSNLHSYSQCLGKSKLVYWRQLRSTTNK